MSRRVLAILTIGTIALVAVVWKGRSQQAALPDFSGAWELVSASGTRPPDGLLMQTNQSSTALRVDAHWTEPANGAYGLTLVGLITPELTFSLDGREDL